MPDSEYADLGSNPISSENPVGEDIRYEPDFEWVQEEIAKLSKAVLVRTGEEEEDQPGKPHFVYEEVDWDEIVRRSETILRERCKDLRIAAWLTRGLIELRAFEGMVDGLTVFTRMTGEYWDNVHPQRPNARAAVIELLRDYIKEACEGGRNTKALSVSAGDEPVVTRVSKLVSKLNSIVTEKLPDSSISFNLVESALEKKIAEARARAEQQNHAVEDSATETAQAEAPQQQVHMQSQPVAPPPATGPAHQAPGEAARQEDRQPGLDFSKSADRQKYFTDLQKLAIEYHSHGIKQNPRDPVPYVWIRSVFWFPLGFTENTPFIPMQSPNETLRKSLSDMYDSGEWGDLLSASERQFPSFWFWLDLQRYTVEALEALGSDYDEARQAVVSQNIFLLRRMPFFVNFNTQDGVSVASAETQEWLQETASRKHAEAEAPPVAADIRNLTSGESRDTLSYDAKGSVQENLEKAREYLQSSRSERDSFIAQLKLSELLLHKKEIVLAYSYLDRLSSLIGQHQLEVWEPELAVDALKVLHACCLRMSRVRKDEKRFFIEQARAIVQRIAALDPVVAAEAVKRGS